MKTKRPIGWRLPAFYALPAYLLLGLVAGPGNAASFEFGDDFTLDLDTTLSYGAQWRTESRNTTLIADDYLRKLQLNPFLPVLRPSETAVAVERFNGDDGNRNFDTGLISNRLAVVVDMDLNWRNVGFFVRGRAQYDTVYKDAGTDLSDFGFRSYNGGSLYGGDANQGEFPQKTRDRHGSSIELLDYFFYGTFDLPGQRLFDIRVGSQVINWGESTFYQGINALQNRVDVIAANTPGVEVKEILLPTGAVYGQIDLLSNLTFEAYYQYEWRRSQLNGVGSYFSTNDLTGPGAQNLLIPSPVGGNAYNLLAASITDTEVPSDQGQWGSALHFITDGGTDYGFYYTVGHDKKPSVVRQNIEVSGQQFPINYHQRYFDGIRAAAASFSSVWGTTNMQGEFTYQSGASFTDADGVAQRRNTAKAQLGGSHVFGPSRAYDDLTFTFEGYAWQAIGQKDEDMKGDARSLGWSALAEFSYNNVAQGVDLKVPVFFRHDVSGTVPELQTFAQAKTLNVGLKAIYLNNFTMQIAYTTYFGGGANNLLIDRDNVALTLKYAF